MRCVLSAARRRATRHLAVRSAIVRWEAGGRRPDDAAQQLKPRTLPATRRVVRRTAADEGGPTARSVRLPSTTIHPGPTTPPQAAGTRRGRHRRAPRRETIGTGQSTRPDRPGCPADTTRPRATQPAAPAWLPCGIQPDRQPRDAHRQPPPSPRCHPTARWFPASSGPVSLAYALAAQPVGSHQHRPLPLPPPTCATAPCGWRLAKPQRAHLSAPGLGWTTGAGSPPTASTPTRNERSVGAPDRPLGEHSRRRDCHVVVTCVDRT